MAHTIKNQHGKYIQGEVLLNEIYNLLSGGLDYSYIDGKKISVISDYRKDKERETIIKVEDA